MENLDRIWTRIASLNKETVIEAVLRDERQKALGEKNQSMVRELDYRIKEFNSQSCEVKEYQSADWLEYVEDVVGGMLDGEAGHEPFIDDLGDTKDKLENILLILKEARG